MCVAVCAKPHASETDASLRGLTTLVRCVPLRTDGTGLYCKTPKQSTAVRHAAQPERVQDHAKEHAMLGTIALILVILWLLGLVSSYTLGGYIHILLVIAVVVILFRLIQGRRL